MKKAFASAFLGFEIIFSFVITNSILILGSVMSGLFLFPVLLTSMVNYIRKMYYYKEYNGIIYTFFTFLKGRVLKSFKVMIPLVIFIVILLLNVYYFNGILVDYFGEVIRIIILIVQLFALYQAIGVLFLVALQLSIDINRGLIESYKYSFILFNAYFFRSMLAMSAFLAVIVLAVLSANYLFFGLLPIALAAFYIVFSDVYERHVERKIG